MTTRPEPTDQGGAWISSGQIYAELRRIGDEVVQLRVELGQVTQLRATVADARAEIDQLRQDVEELKARRWPLQTVAVLTGVAGTVIAIVALFVQ